MKKHIGLLCMVLAGLLALLLCSCRGGATESAAGESAGSRTETRAEESTQESTKEATHMRLVCIGDSNTYGYDPCDALDTRYDEDVIWTSLLAQEGYEVFNFGVNGLRIDEADASYLEAVLPELTPGSVAVVMLGTNDVCCGASAETAGERLTALLDRLTALAPEVQLVVIAPPPLSRDVWATEKTVLAASEQLGEVFASIAASYGAAFADAADWGIGMAYDGVHLSQEGHAAFAKGLSALFAALP